MLLLACLQELQPYGHQREYIGLSTTCWFGILATAVSYQLRCMNLPSTAHRVFKHAENFVA